AKVAALRLAAERVEAAKGVSGADQPASTADLTARALIASLPDLLKLDGYERKARSKRDKAFRELIGSRACAAAVEGAQIATKNEFGGTNPILGQMRSPRPAPDDRAWRPSTIGGRLARARPSGGASPQATKRATLARPQLWLRRPPPRAGPQRRESWGG